MRSVTHAAATATATGGGPAQLRLGALNDALDPPFAWYGAKHAAARLIARALPPHAVYVEVCAGSGAVFFAAPAGGRSRAVLNDLNPHSPAALRGIRDNCDAVWGQLPRSLDAHVWRACADVIRSPLPAHCDVCTASAVIAAFAGAFNNTPYSGVMSSHAPRKWARLYGGVLRGRLEAASRKLAGVKLCSFDAVRLLDALAGPGVLFFCDPPYMRREQGGGSRGAAYAGYGFADPPAEWHAAFLDALARAVSRGADAVVTTGFDPLYQHALPAAGLREVAAFGREQGAPGRGQRRAKHLLWATRTG